ncbi:outer membrane beta-barrel family protein [Phenylobacterium sp.]|jgi:outer membrane receptor protein involved in Fe transport|uniref:outer membrane beta-barrel family protein n=1 Tax=Phenylobacterium sp. TaxID=1871053 RepID=UPI002F95EC91
MRSALMALTPLALLAPGAALAQAPPPKPPPPKTVDEVVVSGAAPDVRTSIDRTSYNVAKDLSSVSGSIADGLRNVPSVEVDVQGNVSLRGDPNVTIMIDGKPSGQFRGEGRGAALQALPAEQIERVEVITNPSAEFSPEGAAGIINLVTKKARKPGYSGSVRASYGTEGRTNGGLTGAYNAERLALNGSFSWRTDPQKFKLTDQREYIDPATGAVTSSSGQTDQRGRGRILNLRGGVDYDLDEANRLSGELRFLNIVPEVELFEGFEARDPDGRVVRAYQRLGRSDLDHANGELSGTWRRKFGQDHELTAVASYEVTRVENDRPLRVFDIVPVAPEQRDDFSAAPTLRQTELKADYVRPLGGEAKLKAGYALQVDANRYENAASVPGFTNLFKYAQQINAGYVTYEKPLGDWTVLAGLRLEDVRIDLDQVTTGLTAENDYFRAYPSLHVSNQLNERDRVTVSYSRRVQRPFPFDLNPFVTYSGPFDRRSGNPNLKPQETDSFEALWQRREGGTFYQATLYYRRSRHGFTDVIRELPGGVLLTTKENLGRGRAAGVELVANGRLSAKLTYNASVNAYWNEIDAAGLGFPGKRSGATLGGRANLNWQPTAKDFVQVNAVMNGERLLPQGTLDAIGVVNLGYRRKLTDNLAALVTWNDVFASLRQVQRIDTPTLRLRQEFTGNGRAAFVGLVWTFGGNGQKPREPGFDFGGGL